MLLGWVDFSEQDRKQMQDTLGRLTPPTTIDELGLDPLENAYSDMFFPGIAAGYSRAKYLVLVPCLLRDVMQENRSRTAMMADLERRERQCAHDMIHNKNTPESEKWGIVGKGSLQNGWVAQPPSRIFWKGIVQYGICRQRVTIQELFDLEERNPGRGCGLLDLPEDSDRWQEKVTISLTAKEAGFLHRKISESCPGTLLAWLLDNRPETLNQENSSFKDLYLDMALNHPGDPGLNLILPLMKQACDCNLLAEAARVRFRCFLTEGNNPEAEARWEKIVSNPAAIQAVDAKAVVEECHLENQTESGKLIIFLQQLQQSIQEDTKRNAAEAKPRWNCTYQVLVQRESERKGKERSKLLRPDRSHLTTTSAPYDRFHFRFETVRSIVNEICKAESGGAP